MTARAVFEWIAEKLSRVTSSREFIPEVDGLRFIAIVPVLILHSSADILMVRGWKTFGAGWADDGPVLRAIGAGAIGVPIFFVLSGFIVCLPFARHALAGAPKPALRRYYLRRLTRIEPPYIIALIAAYLFTREYRQLFPDLVAGLFYLHKIVFGTWNPINGVTWSLEVEVFFYLLAPWLTRVYEVRGRRVLLAAFIAISSYAIHAWLIPYGPRRLNDTLIAALPFFAAGMLLADLYAAGSFRRSRRIAWDVAAAGAASGLVYAAGWEWARLYWLAPPAIVVLFTGAMEGRLANRLFRLRPVTIAGGMCYTMYLWHIPLLIVMRPILSRLLPREIGDTTAAVLYSAIAAPCLMAASAPLFYFIEKPFMRARAARLAPGVPARRAERCAATSVIRTSAGA